MELSYSKLKEFIDCSNKFFLKRILKKTPINGNQEDMKKGSLKHWFMAERIAKQFALPFMEKKPIMDFQNEQEAINIVENFDVQSFVGRVSIPLAVEKVYKVKLTDDVFLTAKVDFLLEDPVELQMEIVDWKFGRATSDVDDDMQGIFYALCVIESEGLNEVKFTKHFVKYNDSRSKVFTRKEVEKFKKYLIEIVNMMRNLEVSNEGRIKTVTDRCFDCSMKHYCGISEEIVNTNVEDLAEQLIAAKTSVKRIESTLKSITKENNGEIEISRGALKINSTRSFRISKGELSKDEVIEKLLKDAVDLVIDGGTFDLKWTPELVDFAKNRYNVSFTKSERQSFVFEKGE